MLMASGIRFGRKKSLPHFFGIWLGFNFLFFLGGNLLSYVPDIVFEYLQYAGYIVILYIAYRVAITPKESVFSSGGEATLVLHWLLGTPVFSPPIRRYYIGVQSVGRHTACKAVPTFEHTTSHTACAVSRFSCAERHTRPRRLAARSPLGHTPALSLGDASCQFSPSR